MAGNVADFWALVNPTTLATRIADQFVKYNRMRQEWIEQKKELRNYVFATDTNSTTNATIGWKNSTTIPKICQIRDNLHANYFRALFPNDDWLRWEADDESSEDMAETIEAYMKAKCRESNFKETVSRLIYDYIDAGNVFADVEYVNRDDVNEDTGEQIKGYIGPRAIRISPYDIIINPAAKSFAETPKITRYVKSLGELEYEAQTMPEMGFNRDVIEHMKAVRRSLRSFDQSDWAKAEGLYIDGFGSLQEYYGSGTVEIIEFEGNLYDYDNEVMLRDVVITVVDRAYIIRQQKQPRWIAGSSKVHAGWRLRPDNLYAMGPLDNLVGMQYRIDHLENLKADVFDLIAHPPLVLKGDVEDFEWGPYAEIYVSEDGSVDMLKLDATALNADFQIERLMNTMEEMAGAPKQAMGIRTPGEKTAFEVQQLENAASRIFQEKIDYFSTQVLEPLLNNMLESARRNMSGVDTIRVIDEETGVADFLKIKKEHLIRNGKIRPIGARHFAAQAQLMQNLNGIFNSTIAEKIAPHVSSKKLAELVEDVMGLEKFELIRENVAVFEQAETQQLVAQAQEGIEIDQMTDIEGEEDALK